MSSFLGWLTRPKTAASSESKKVVGAEDGGERKKVVGDVIAAVPKLNLLRASSEHVVQPAAVAKEAARTARTKREGTKNGRPKSAARGSQALIVAPPADFSGFLSQKARVVMEGRMNKLKGRGVGKSWVPQHFILKADAFYYTPNKQFSHKEKKVSLVKTKIGTAQHYTKKENAFGVMDVSSRSLHIMCVESESLMHEWIKALIAVRTALEGRARDSQPNAALALNPRYPHIPSLPPPRTGSSTSESRPTYLAHLTDSEGEGEDMEEGYLADDAHVGTPSGGGVAAISEPPSSRPPAAPQEQLQAPQTQKARRSQPALRAPVAARGRPQRAEDPLGLVGLSRRSPPASAAAGVERLGTFNLTEQDSDDDSDFALAVTIQPSQSRAGRAPEMHQCERTDTPRRGSVISPARQRTPLAAPAPLTTPRDGAVRAVLVGAPVMGRSAAYPTQMVRMELACRAPRFILSSSSLSRLSLSVYLT
jgi:hypothetical protein